MVSSSSINNLLVIHKLKGKGINNYKQDKFASLLKIMADPLCWWVMPTEARIQSMTWQWRERERERERDLFGFLYHFPLALGCGVWISKCGWGRIGVVLWVTGHCTPFHVPSSALFQINVSRDHTPFLPIRIPYNTSS